MTRLFEIPEIITLSGTKLNPEMDFDEMAALAGGNGCTLGGGSNNGCLAGGGSDNGCPAGGGGTTLEGADS